MSLTSYRAAPPRGSGWYLGRRINHRVKPGGDGPPRAFPRVKCPGTWFDQVVSLRSPGRSAVMRLTGCSTPRPWRLGPRVKPGEVTSANASLRSAGLVTDGLEDLAATYSPVA